MKLKSNFFMTTLGVVAFLFVLAHPAVSQTDPGWYVLNMKGRNSVDASGVISYPNAISGIFSIEGERHPNRLCHPWAKNDVFIIYDDYTFFSARESPVAGATPYPVDFFYPASGGSALLETTHGFVPPGGKRVAHMYMTSKYEDNDPPPPARAVSGINTGVSTYSPGVSVMQDFLDANHDVVSGRDITLIINLERLRQIEMPKEPREKQFILKTNRIHRLFTTDTLSLASAFTPSGEFASYGWYPHDAISKIDDNTFRIDPSKAPFCYLNLRNKSDLAFGFPAANNGAVAYEMLFDLYAVSSSAQLNNLNIVKPLEIHTEAMQSSHDPNVVRVDATCDMNGSQYVLYHIQFQNNAVVSANNLKVELDFPADFDEHCITASNWKAGTNTNPGTIEYQNGKVYLKFPPDASVIMCPSDDDSVSCRGMVDIRIAINAGAQLRNPAYSLKPECHVFFGNDKYPIHRYEDPMDIETIRETKDKSGGIMFEILRPPSITQCGTPCTPPCTGIFCRPWWQYVTVLLILSIVIFAYRRFSRPRQA